MRNSGCCSGSNAIGLLLVRVPVGIVLALAGCGKFKLPGGVNEFVSNSIGQVPAYMPPWFGNVYLHAVPYAEVALGAMLVLGLLTRVSGTLAALMLVSFGLSAGGAAGFFNAHPDVAPQLFKAPFTYGVLALVAAFAGPGAISVDRLLFRGRKDVTYEVPTE